MAKLDSRLSLCVRKLKYTLTINTQMTTAKVIVVIFPLRERCAYVCEHFKVPPNMYSRVYLKIAYGFDCGIWTQLSFAIVTNVI